MDNRKNRILPPQLALLLTALSAPTLLIGCSSDAPVFTIPHRMRDLPSLVQAGELNDASFAMRNDARLGSNRDPIVRSTVQSTAFVVDRQRIINGRPYNDYQFTTRTGEVLRP